jgi:hypothetical protein
LCISACQVSRVRDHFIVYNLFGIDGGHPKNVIADHFEEKRCIRNKGIERTEHTHVVFLFFSSHHVDRIAAKNENNQSATEMQNISTVGNETDVLVFHLMMTSRNISDVASNDSVPPILGIIAMDLAKGEKLPLIIFLLSRRLIGGGGGMKRESVIV